MKGATNHLTPGERVAYYRRRRGYTQEVLAGLVGKTVSWLEKIESGRANLQVIGSITDLARALDISPLELMPDDIVEVDAFSRGSSVPALRQRVLSYRFVNPRFLGEAAHPLPLPKLEAAVDAIWRSYQASRFSMAITLLHRLLPAAVATLATAKGEEIDQTKVQLAFLYQVAACVLTKIGEHDLAFTCADRGERLAAETTDVTAQASVQRTIAHTLMSTGHYDDAMAVIQQTLDISAGLRSTPALLSAAGTLHLVGAMTAARQGLRADARTHLDHAQRAAADLGVDANLLWTAFGPTNVAIHEVAVAAEMGDYQRAAALGTAVDVAGMPTERQVRHRLEVARALHHQHKREDALALVLDAERIAPDQVRRHFLTHALVQEWVRSKRVTLSPELHGIAQRTGIIAA